MLTISVTPFVITFTDDGGFKVDPSLEDHDNELVLPEFKSIKDGPLRMFFFGPSSQQAQSTILSTSPELLQDVSDLHRFKLERGSVFLGNIRSWNQKKKQLRYVRATVTWIFTRCAEASQGQ